MSATNAEKLASVKGLLFELDDVMKSAGYVDEDGPSNDARVKRYPKLTELFDWLYKRKNELENG